MATAYVVERAVQVRAPAERVHALISDFRRWRAWSPWEGADPQLQRGYAGPESGVGSVYTWAGNRKAGTGRMQITSDAPQRVEIDLHFEKPFRSDSMVAYTLVPTDQGTEVTWRMTGEQTGVMGVLGKLLSMDRMVGKDFERGLVRLKAVAEHSQPL